MQFVTRTRQYRGARRLTGTMEYEGEFREDRQARPIDLLADMVNVGGGGPATPKVSEDHYRMEAIFLEIETDEGVTGRAGSISTTRSVCRRCSASAFWSRPTC